MIKPNFKPAPGYQRLIPGLFSWEAQEKHKRRAKQWENYARRITRNPKIKDYLWARSLDCAYCKLPIRKDAQVHHITYDHFCKTAQTVTVHDPTFNAPDRTAIAPDCQACWRDTPQKFHDCARRLALVHPLCNKALHDDHKDQRIERIKESRLYKFASSIVITATILYFADFLLN